MNEVARLVHSPSNTDRLDYSHSDRRALVSLCGLNHLFLVTEDDYCLMCLLAICVSSLEKCLLKSFPYFLVELFIFLLFFADSENKSFIRYDLQIFSPSLQFVFHILKMFVEEQRFLILMMSHFFFWIILCDELSKKALPSIRS